MNIKGETIQNREPTPEHPVDIENKINLTGAIQILNKLKSKVTLVEADEKEYRLPFLTNIEQQAIETVLEELENKQDDINILQAQRDSMEYQFKQAKAELEKKDKEYEELTEASKELCKTVNLMKKVINEMAKHIHLSGDYECLNKECEDDGNKDCKECIKEYFTNKVEKEGIKDEQNYNT